MSLRITFRPGPSYSGPLELTFGGRGARGLPGEGGDGGGGAPTNAPYVTFGSNGTLSNERVLSDGAGTGIDTGTAGQVKVNNTDRGSVAVAGHVEATDPHPQYAQDTDLDGYLPLTGGTVSGATTFDDVNVNGQLTTTNILCTGIDTQNGDVNAGAGAIIGDGSQLTGVTKAQVGLGNADNTSDADKPVSTATQTALDLKVPTSRTVSAGTGLTGGGDLSANRSLAADFGTGSGKVCEGNDSRLSDTRTPTDNTVSTAKLQADAVTYAKIQNVSATDKVLGRSTAGAGDVEEIACTSAGRALIDDADAAAQRATLGLSTIAKDVFISSPADGTVVLTAKARFAGTINGIYGLKTSSGSLTLKVQIGGVDVTSLTGLSVTTSAQDVSATGANTFAVGDRITIVISSSSTPANLEFTLQATR